MSGYFSVLASASLQAAVLAGLVLVLQWALRKHIPARWRFALWLLVFVRLSMIPLPESRLSIFNWMPAAPQSVAHMTHNIVGGHVLIDPEISGPAIEEKEIAAPITGRAFSWQQALEAAYFAGMGIVVLRLALAMLALRRIVRAAAVVEDAAPLNLLAQAKRTLAVRRNVRLMSTDRLESPALIGFIKPRLLVPAKLLANLSQRDLLFVFLHECGHLKRNDVLLNYWMAALEAIHWFNPVMWLVAARVRADRELACDEMVMMHTPDPMPYGEMLLTLIENAGTARGCPAAVGIVEAKAFFKRRIQMIAAFRRTSKWLVLPAMGLLALVAAATLTGAVTRAAEKVVAADVPLPPGYANAAANEALVAKLKDELAHLEVDRQVHASQVSGNDRKLTEMDTRIEALKTQIAQVDTGRVMTIEGNPGVFKTGDGKTTVNAQSISFTVSGDDADSPANREVLARLDKPMKEMSVDQVGFEKVIDFLRDTTDCNILVKWNTLEAAGINRNTPVTIHLKNVAVRKVLKTALEQAGNGNVLLAYIVDDGVLTITTRDDPTLASQRIMRVYNVRDLLAIPLATSPSMLAPNGAQSTTESATVSETSDLITVIEKNASPESWQDMGGSIGAIGEFKGLLTITTTPEIHRQVAAVLQALRDADKNDLPRK